MPVRQSLSMLRPPFALALALLVTAAGCAQVRAPDDDDDDVIAGDDDDSAASDDDDNSDDDDSAEANAPPQITSTAPEQFVISEAFASNFEPNQLFMASSGTDEIRVYDATTLAFLQAFTHPSFAVAGSPAFRYGPNGVAFNERGNLVVAAYEVFVEFSDYGVEYATYAKQSPEATENLLFDRDGNLYTTTSTGGTDLLIQYRALDYAYEQQIPTPASAGQYTGITFDGRNRLYLASQSDATIHVAEANPAFTAFTWVAAWPSGNPGGLEGLQFNRDGNLVAAGGDLVLYETLGGTVVTSFDAPTDAYPVPVRVDNDGNIFTADYENGSGTAPADIYRFSPDGSTFDMINDPGLYGPFGGAVSGVVLSGDPPVEYVYPVQAVDPDGDTLQFSLVEAPFGMTIDAGTGALSWLVTSFALGSYPVTVRVEDGHGGSDEQSWTLVVLGS